MTRALALRVPQPGGVDVLTAEEVDVPDPGPGEVRVRVAASGVNFIDVYQRAGIYPIPTPFTLGSEGAGIVESVGEGVSLLPGQHVAWAMLPGSHAEMATLPADRMLPVPDDIDLVTAAAVPLQGMTAHFLTDAVYSVEEGDHVLVHAAAGGIGQWLVQLCAARGASVIATAGSSDKLDLAQSLGAAHAIDYTQVDDLAAAVRECTPDGRGVDVVYDGVGKATFDASLASLRRRGTLAVFGGASGQVPPFDLQRLNAAGSVMLTRPSLAHFVGLPDELPWRGRETFEAVHSGHVQLQIGGRYEISEAAAAYEALEGRASTGKLVFVH